MFVKYSRIKYACHNGWNDNAGSVSLRRYWAV